MFQVPGRRAASLQIGRYTNFLDTTLGVNLVKVSKLFPHITSKKACLKHSNLSFHVKSHLYIPIVSYIEIYRFI